MPNINITDKRPKIGIALGGGAAKATCEYGMLKKIVEHNIPIDYIMGSSCGSMVGALYALNLDLKETEEKILSYFEKGKFNSWMNINFLHGSFFKGDYISKFLKYIFGDKTFADCKIPFACTAVDLESGEEVVFKEGKLWEAIMASSSIPGFIDPFYKDGHFYVDGGLLEDVPFSTMRKENNPDLLIGMKIVDNSNKQFISAIVFNRFSKKNKFKALSKVNFVSKFWKSFNLESQLFIRIIDRSITILRDELFKYKKQEAHPDLLLEIEVNEYEAFDFKNINKIIIKGEILMNEYMPEFLKLIEKKKHQLNSKFENDNVKA